MKNNSTFQCFAHLGLDFDVLTNRHGHQLGMRSTQSQLTRETVILKYTTQPTTENNSTQIHGVMSLRGHIYFLLSVSKYFQKPQPRLEKICLQYLGHFTTVVLPRASAFAQGCLVTMSFLQHGLFWQAAGTELSRLLIRLRSLTAL